MDWVGNIFASMEDHRHDGPALYLYRDFLGMGNQRDGFDSPFVPASVGYVQYDLMRPGSPALKRHMDGRISLLAGHDQTLSGFNIIALHSMIATGRDVVIRQGSTIGCPVKGHHIPFRHNVHFVHRHGRKIKETYQAVMSRRGKRRVSSVR